MIVISFKIEELLQCFNNVLDALDLETSHENSPCTVDCGSIEILRTQAALKRQFFSEKSRYNNVTRWPGKDANYKLTN